VSEPTSAEIRAGLAPLPDTPAGRPDDRTFRDRIARHDQPVRIGASSETGPLVITVPGGDDVQRILRELGAVINNLRAENSHLTAQNTALTEALRKSAAATTGTPPQGQVAFAEYDRATREALAIVVRERDEAREKLARMREDRDRLNAQRNALAGANDAWIRDVDAARAELATVTGERDALLLDVAARQRDVLAFAETIAGVRRIIDRYEAEELNAMTAFGEIEELFAGDEDGDAAETAAILADPETMAAIAEGESELPGEARDA
jgi:hypothetical protein